jgi:hypothetical protein
MSNVLDPERAPYPVNVPSTMVSVLSTTTRVPATFIAVATFGDLSRSASQMHNGAPNQENMMSQTMRMNSTATPKHIPTPTQTRSTTWQSPTSSAVPSLFPTKPNALSIAPVSTTTMVCKFERCCC